MGEIDFKKYAEKLETDIDRFVQIIDMSCNISKIVKDNSALHFEDVAKKNMFPL